MRKPFLLILSLSLFSTAFQSDTETTKLKPKKNVKRIKSLVPLLFDKTPIQINSTQKNSNCDWMRGYKYQREQCQVRMGLEKLLLEVRERVIKRCEKSFEYDTWNCSYDKEQFKKMNRETAFMQSLAAAALMYYTTQACSNRKLEKCKCDMSKEYFINVPEYKGFNFTDCQDNTKSGRILTRKFLMMNNNGKKALVTNSNIRYGIRTAMESVKVICKCRSVLSCAFKICEKRLQPFGNIMEKLKLGYHRAIQLKRKHLSLAESANARLPKNRLLFLTDSPNFCNFTAGRRCPNAAKCATLCCARGFNTRTITVPKECNYRLAECCYRITHDICAIEEEIYECR